MSRMETLTLSLVNRVVLLRMLTILSILYEIMYEIMRLSGQEYVDMYATQAKEESKRLEAEAKAAADGRSDDEAGPAGEQKKAS